MIYLIDKILVLCVVIKNNLLLISNISNIKHLETMINLKIYQKVSGYSMIICIKI